MTGVPLRAYLLVNAATLMWAGNVVLGRALRGEIGPWTLAALRAAVASLCFAALLLRARRPRPTLGRRGVLLLLAMAVTGVVGFQVLQYAGLRETSAVNAGLVNATGPLLTLGLSRVLLGQPLRRVQAWGALLSLVGVYFVLGAGSWSGAGAGFNRGDLLVLAAVTMWSLYSITGRVALRAGGTLWVTALSTAAALPLLAVPAAWECFASPPRLQASLFLALAYIGVGPSFLAFLAWNEGVRLAGPRGAMAFYNTLPLYATLLATLFLGERPGLPQLVGGALVVAGCLLAVVGRPAAD